MNTVAKRKSRKAKKRRTRIYQQRMSPNEQKKKKHMRLAELLMKNDQNQRVTYTDFSDLIK